jgi:hypothetical protein
LDATGAHNHTQLVVTNFGLLKISWRTGGIDVLFGTTVLARCTIDKHNPPRRVPMLDRQSPKNEQLTNVITSHRQDSSPEPPVPWRKPPSRFAT